MADDVQHRRVVGSEIGGAAEHLDTELASERGDLVGIGRHDDALDGLARLRRVEGPGEQRPAGQRDEVLARDSLRPPARRDEGEHVHVSR
jgi:hypothetical protein